MDGMRRTTTGFHVTGFQEVEGPQDAGPVARSRVVAGAHHEDGGTGTIIGRRLEVET